MRPVLSGFEEIEKEAAEEEARKKRREKEKAKVSQKRN